MTRQERLEQLKQQREAERRRIRDEKIQAEIDRAEEMLAAMDKKVEEMESKYKAFKEWEALNPSLEKYLS